MKFLGIPIDVLSVIAGAFFGATFRGKMTVAYQRVVLMACGLVAAVVGIFGAYDNLIIFEADKLELGGSLLIVFALVTGTILGGGFGLSKLLAYLGKSFSKGVVKKERDDGFRAKRLAEKNAGKTGKASLSELPVHEISPTRFETRHVEGFVTATMLLTFGFLAVNAPFEAMTEGKMTLFYVKAAVDFVLAFALTTVYGLTVSYAAIPVAIADIAFTIAASGVDLAKEAEELSPVWGQLAVISSVIMLAAGVCLALGKKFKFENMIPSLLIPPIYYGVVDTVTKMVEKSLEK